MSGGCLRDFDQFFLFQFLNSTPGSQVSPVKNNEFWGVCGVSGRCLMVSNTVWIVSGLRDFDQFSSL